MQHFMSFPSGGTVLLPLKLSKSDTKVAVSKVLWCNSPRKYLKINVNTLKCQGGHNKSTILKFKCRSLWPRWTSVVQHDTKYLWPLWVAPVHQTCLKCMGGDSETSKLDCATVGLCVAGLT